MRIALVTGANRGIGLETVRALAELDHRVVLTARDVDAGRRAADRLSEDGLPVEAVELDVTSASSIAAAVDEVGDRHGRLDVLVNNAGIVAEDPTGTDREFADPDVFAPTFAVNVFGAVAVTEGFLPLLRRSDAGRIVNVSSRMGSQADQLDPASPFYATHVPAYQASKAALNNVTVVLHKRLLDTPITVTAVCPGFVQTDLTPVNRSVGQLTAAEAAQTVVAAATRPGAARSGTFVDRDGDVPW